MPAPTKPAQLADDPLTVDELTREIAQSVSTSLNLEQQYRFDPDKGYRNLLIALSREILKLEEIAERQLVSDHSGVRAAGHLRNGLTNELRQIIRRNAPAMQHYFRTRRPQDIYQLPIT